jgi:hypothetical protein
VLSIGSGSVVDAYRELLERHLSDHKWRNTLLMGESMPGGGATMLASSVTGLLKRHPQPGISSHVHLCVARRGEVKIWPNDHSFSGRWEAYSLGPPDENPTRAQTGMNNFTMPQVATTYDELCGMLPANASKAVAVGSSRFP